MRTADIEDFLSRGLDGMGILLDNEPEVLSRLSLYFQELKKWNRKINLVARSLDDKQILEKHFLDALSLLLLLPHNTQEQETVLDVGTGAGFPGLVLKAACPELKVAAVEPRENRFFFLKHITRTLDLIGMEVFNARLTETVQVKELSGRRFSFITSRAFTDISHLIKLAAPYLEKAGRIVLMKGPGAIAELNEFERKGGNGIFLVEEIKKIYLPFSKSERLLVSIKGPDHKLH